MLKLALGVPCKVLEWWSVELWVSGVIRVGYICSNWMRKWYTKLALQIFEPLLVAETGRTRRGARDGRTRRGAQDGAHETGRATHETGRTRENLADQTKALTKPWGTGTTVQPSASSMPSKGEYGRCNVHEQPRSRKVHGEAEVTRLVYNVCERWQWLRQRRWQRQWQR